MASHLSSGRVNLAVLRESYRRELLDCLDKCTGSKVNARFTFLRFIVAVNVCMNVLYSDMIIDPPTSGSLFIFLQI